MDERKCRVRSEGEEGEKKGGRGMDERGGRERKVGREGGKERHT